MNKPAWGLIWTPEVSTPDGLIVGPPVHNLIPREGLDHLTGLLLGTAPLISNWHSGLFENNYIPSENSRAEDILSSLRECQTYTGERPLWTPDIGGDGVIDNAVNRCVYEFTEDKRLYGGFMVSASAKGSGLGVMLSVARFSSPVDVTAGSTLRLRVATIMVST